MGDDAERLASVAAVGVRFINGQLCAIQHASTPDLVRVVIEWREESDADLGEVFEVRIGDFAGRAVVFDEVLIVLVVQSSKLCKRTEVLRGACIRFERARSR